MVDREINVSSCELAPILNNSIELDRSQTKSNLDGVGLAGCETACEVDGLGDDVLDT